MVTWSASRGQANVSKGKTQLGPLKSDNFQSAKEAKVCLFDNIKLGKAGEYFVRGKVGNTSFNEGYFDPGSYMYVSVQETHDVIVATSIERMDERNLIPVTLLTLKDNIN